jgi:hypothetical protein
VIGVTETNGRTTTNTSEPSTVKGRLSAVKDAVPDPTELKQSATKAATDIKSGAAKAATDIKSGAAKKAADIKSGAAKAAEQVKLQAAKGKEGLTDNPLVLGLISAASGFAVGMLVPLTPVESQRLPEIAGRAKDATLTSVGQTRKTGMLSAAEQIESVGGAAIAAVAEQARKIPGATSVADKIEESAKRGTRKVARTVREKAEA